ncbi:B-cell receptor CD22-like isoform X1 [Labrus mixtus]|uniref:B-cell receptor CD22-like isoform X1 n=1 Tax=Labrus mixtus TaxID=508554 RepID=UPI0029C040B1|nr:B-cell receptor CD22-like isoform X1 [Labrus mixtus]
MIAFLVLSFLGAGTVGADRDVTFENPNPCAVEGSSVEFRCSYNYQDGQTVRKTEWYKGELKNGVWIRVKLSDLPSYRNRFEFIGDQQHDCSLALHDLQHIDTGYYYFRFDTDMFGWRSKTSVYLSVTELHARVYPDTVRAGDSVSLQCNTSCHLSSTVWFKDGHPVSKPEFQVQAEDAGNYFCAVEGQESVQSEPVALYVQYPPLNVSVEVTYPDSQNESSSVNLTCSSSANPAAQNYTWFRRTASPSSGSSSMFQVGSGQVMSLPSMHVNHTGLYLCQARNTVGETNSTEVLLTISANNHGLFHLGVTRNHTEINKELWSSLSLSQVILLIGVKVVILVALTLVIIWAGRHIRIKNEEENDHDYENESTGV